MEQRPLNRFLVEEAVKLSVRSILALAAKYTENKTPSADIEHCLIDLFCWQGKFAVDKDYKDLLKQAFKFYGTDLTKANVLPVDNGLKPKLSCLSEIYAWDDSSLQLLKKKLILKHTDAHLLKENISQRRQQSLQAFSKNFFKSGIIP